MTSQLYESGFSREAEPIERKELAPSVVEAGESEICRAGQQAGDRGKG